MSGTNVQHEPIGTLRTKLAAFPVELRKAATWILEHQSDAAVYSLRAIAKAARVHPNTITRLTRELGFATFKDFRLSLQARLTSAPSFPDRAAWLQSLSGESARDQLFADLARDSTGNIDTLFRGVQAGQFEAAAKLIVEAGATYVLGVGMANALAENFAYMLGMAMPNVHAVPAAGGLPIDALARAGRGDVLLAMTFKPYRREVVEAVQVAHQQGMQIIALSDSLAAPILKDAKHQFIVPTETPQFFTSTIALAALLESLMAFVIANSDAQAVASIKQFHERRHALGIYWEKE